MLYGTTTIGYQLNCYKTLAFVIQKIIHELCITNYIINDSTMWIITFRASVKVKNYLKWLKNKSKEINDILELYIWKQQIPVVKESPPVPIDRQREEVLFSKEYYRDLWIYNDIIKRWWCMDKYWERLEIKEALEYAWLSNFTPIK